MLMGQTAAGPIVTLITPTFNQAAYLPLTIDSVLAQDYAWLDYVVVDDGSTDETPEVLERYRGRIRVRRHANIGQARTLNRGWEAAGGKYLAYLSSDDLLHPSCISAMVSALEADPQLVCAFPNSNVIDESGRVVKRSVGRPFSLTDLIVLQECYIGPGAVFRRDAFEAVGGWRPDLNLAPDREFWIRLASRGSFHFDPRPLAQYRLHPRSISFLETSDEVSREFLRVLDMYYAGNPTPECVNRKDEAYGRANIVLARNAFRSAEFARGMNYYREACRLHPPSASLKTKLSLFRNVVSKPLRVAASKLRSFQFRTSG